MQKLIKPLAEGELSQPVRAEDGFHMVMVCGRHKPNTALPTAAQMRRMLAEKRAELLAQNLMRELRQDAVVSLH
jgi:parvulin-like peptidyl-prolyl isomerase